METRSYTNTTPGALRYSSSSTGYHNLSDSRVKHSVFLDGDSRDVYRVDPHYRRAHGAYRREYVRLSNLPNINAKLAYYSQPGVPRTDYRISVSGDGFGFQTPRCRWLYEDEKSYHTLINQAIKGALEQHANLALFIGELGKTADLLGSKASKIAKAMSAVKSGRFTSAGRLLGVRKPRGASRTKSFADNWLEYKYGWGPLLLDSVGLMKHLSQGARSYNITSRSRFSSSIPLRGSQQVQLEQEAAAQHRLSVTWRYGSTWVRNEQVMLVFRLPSNFWDQASRLGFIDPGTLALESIPGSFMLDWFSNLSDWMGSLNLGLTLEYVTGSYVEYHRNMGTVFGTGLWLDTKPALFKYTDTSVNVGRATLTDLKLRRTPIPHAHVNVTLQLQAPLSVNKAITASALVVQQLKLFR